MADDYPVLIADARDALRALLRASEPGTGLRLHTAYNTLREMAEAESKEHREPPQKPPTADSWAEYRQHCRERAAAWKAISHADRARLVFEVLGDDRSTIREVCERLRERLGGGVAVYDGTTRAVLMRLVSEGELHREPESFQGKVRYRYSRNADLSGPIAELERTFHEEHDGSDDR